MDINIKKHHQNLEQSMDSFTRLDPWPHFIVDNFLDERSFLEAQKHVCTAEQDFQILQDDKNEVKYNLLIYMPLAKLFYSIEFFRFISCLSKENLSLNENNLVQLRLADHRTPAFPRHVDETPAGRSLVVLFYLSPDWQVEHGGRLCLHKSRNSPWRDTVYIDPIPNRLVAFFSDNKNWHSIEKVINWKRYSVLSEWMF